MRRLFITLSFIAALGAAGTVMAQQADEATIGARMAEQKTALAPLSRIDGEWRGTAWIADRTGKRTVVVPRFVAETGEIVMSVPDAVLATSQYPAVLDPTVFAVDD